MKQIGRDWLDGKLPDLTSFNGLNFNPKQIEFINSKDRRLLFSGGMRSGKTYAFIIKFILLSQWFPKSNFLIGRKTQGNAEETFMKDFRDVCPPALYAHLKGAHAIEFTNGSRAEFWGLDALQSGASDDIKKAEQKLKSHTFTFILTDQLEEIELKVFEALQTRMSKRMCSHSQDQKIEKENYEICTACGEYTFNQHFSTTNPANYWAYDYFKVNPRPKTKLVETSTLDNKANLTRDFIETELGKPELYKAKFFYGQWDDKSMVEGGVFAEEWILNQRAITRPPIRIAGGIKVFEEPSPTEEYQIGVDPSTGATDPCSIQCISKTTGRQVAKYAANVPIKVVAEKAVQMALMYSTKSSPMIVPEANDSALVEALKPLYENIYIREVYSAIQDKKTSKLGFYTTHATKTLLIENMKSLFASGFPKIYDEDTVNQINKFIYTDTAQEKGAGAQKGYHDDDVMALLLAYWKVPAVYQDNKQNKNTLAQKEHFAKVREAMPRNSSK